MHCQINRSYKSAGSIKEVYKPYAPFQEDREPVMLGRVGREQRKMCLPSSEESIWAQLKSQENLYSLLAQILDDTN